MSSNIVVIANFAMPTWSIWLIGLAMLIWVVYVFWKGGFFRKPAKHVSLSLEEFDKVPDSSDKEGIGFWLLFKEYGSPLIILQSFQHKVVGTFERALCGKRDDKGRPLTREKARKAWFKTSKTLIFESKEPETLFSFVMIYHSCLFKVNYIEVFSYEDFKMIGKISGGYVSGPDLSAEFRISRDKSKNAFVSVIDKNLNRLGFMEEMAMEEHNKLIEFGGSVNYRLVIQPRLTKEQKAIVLAALLRPLQQHLVEGYFGGGGG